MAARFAWVWGCPTHCGVFDQRKAVISLCWGSEEGRSALGLREIKVQGLIRAEGFSVYYKICYSNTVD